MHMACVDVRNTAAARKNTANGYHTLLSQRWSAQNRRAATCMRNERTFEWSNKIRFLIPQPEQALHKEMPLTSSSTEQIKLANARPR